VAKRILHWRAVKVDLWTDAWWEAPLCEGLPGGNRAKQPRYADSPGEVTCRACWAAKSNGVPVNQRAWRLAQQDKGLRLVSVEGVHTEAHQGKAGDTTETDQK
jgi:hypothetical protein